MRLPLALCASLISGCIFYIPPPDAGTSFSDAGLDAGGIAICDATNCASGCCNGSACVSTATFGSCGSNGSVCISCDTLTANRCASGSCMCGATAACTKGDQCINGTCSSTCGTGPLCATGQRCVSGTCVCDATSCATGCCDANVCRTSSAATCGLGGVACVSCDAAKADRCEAGNCRCGMAASCGPTQTCTLGTGAVPTTAVSFDDQQDRLVVPNTAWPTSTTNWTFAAWVRLAVDRNEYSAFFTIEQPAGHSTEYNELVTLSDGTTLVLWDHNNGTVLTLGQMTLGTWYFAAVSVGPNGSAQAWFAPEGGSLSKRTGTAAIVDHVEMSYVGASNFAFTEFVNGSMAMARLWNGVLTDAEVQSEFTSTTPVRTNGLIGDWRLRSAATVTQDSSGLGHNLTRDFGATHGDLAGPTFNGAATRTCTP
ncbi:MAG: hypothetical protein QM817_29825 [Archangium sp.]